MSADKYPCIFSRQMEAIVYMYVGMYVGMSVCLMREDIRRQLIALHQRQQ